ncbi:hypothetical protein FIV07_14440 [Mycobacterium sp. THAF192]|jgi:hypothetical protein|nr:hypothetical protein FIV07_14440 [Mycobacterium sp. THAF192]
MWTMPAVVRSRGRGADLLILKYRLGRLRMTNFFDTGTV